MVLGGDTAVYLAGSVDKMFVARPHRRVTDQGRFTPVLAKRFTVVASGVREVTRTAVSANSVVRGADA